MTDSDHELILEAFLDADLTEKRHMLETVPMLISEASAARLEELAKRSKSTDLGDAFVKHAELIRVSLEGSSRHVRGTKELEGDSVGGN